LSAPPGTARARRIVATDGASADLIEVDAAAGSGDVLLWLPAMGVAARHYIPFAQALAARGIGVALHEWRGIGSSDRRAGWRCNWGYRELLDDLEASVAAITRTHPQARLWIGGHSLGGQLAALACAREPARYAGLVLVASGAPYWRMFRHRWGVLGAYVIAPMLGAAFGHVPGRRIGFGGREARCVIDDWARSGRSGRYRVRGLAVDFERALGASTVPVFAHRLADDWLGPAASLDWLLDTMPLAPREVAVHGSAELGTTADHFGWMKQPDVLVRGISAQMAGLPAHGKRAFHSNK